VKRCHQQRERSRSTCAPQAPQAPHLCKSIVLCGGIGRLEPFYRALVESLGYELIYYQRRIPQGTPPATLAGILVVTTKISHPLRQRAARLAEVGRVPVVYLRMPSVAAVRLSLAELLEERESVA
jgi:hypothetical protein